MSKPITDTAQQRDQEIFAMSHRAAVLTLRVMSFLTVLTLVWAWQFLMATVATTESHTPTSITLVSADLSATRTAVGQRDGRYTREIRARAASTLPDLSLLHRNGTDGFIPAYSLSMGSLIIGALIVCLLAPVRTKRTRGPVVDFGIADREAA